METAKIEQAIPRLTFGGPVRVQSVEEGEPLRVVLGIGHGGRGQTVEISTRREPHLVVRSKICRLADLPEGDSLLWTLTENAGAGLAALVIDSPFIWAEMALLAAHVDEPELALAIEAVALEADRLEAKMGWGEDRF